MTNARMVRVSVVIALCILALYFLSPIITPFFLGALLAYLGDPFVSFLKVKHVPRTVGVMIVFLLVIVFLSVIIFLVLPMMQEQIVLAIQKIPAILLWLQNSVLPWVSSHAHINDYLNMAALKKELAQHSQKIGNIVSLIIKTASHSTLAMVDFVMNLILVPVVAFYLMRDWPKIMQNIQAILPHGSRTHVVSLARQCNEVVSAFFKGQLLVMLGLAIIYSTGLWLIGLQVAIFVGLLAGLLSIVPYLGFTIGILVASLAMFIETHTFLHVVYVWGIFAVGQMCESMVLTPLLVGDKIGLHPVAVIFAILAGGVLFGFLGVLLALPVAAMILVVLKQVIRHATAA
ncbi:MAG: AI-2E family transporter [Pseudomonadota bacterium]